MASIMPQQESGPGNDACAEGGSPGGRGARRGLLTVEAVAGR
ncbi:hypothetical protein AB0C61_36090 [Streptomyces sp. NPDC048680]